MDQATRAFQHAARNAFRTTHFPQDIGMDAALAAGHIPGALGLGDAALDAVFNQFLMPVAARFAVIDLADDIAIRIIAIGIDGRECANAAGRGPGAASAPIGNGNAFAAFHQRQDINAPHPDRIDGLQVTALPNEWSGLLG